MPHSLALPLPLPLGLPSPHRPPPARALSLSLLHTHAHMRAHSHALFCAGADLVVLPVGIGDDSVLMTLEPNGGRYLPAVGSIVDSNTLQTESGALRLLKVPHFLIVALALSILALAFTLR